MAVLASLLAGCASAGRPGGSAARSAPSAPTTDTTVATTTTSPPTTVPGPPYQIASTVVKLVDTSRPTVSHGHEISSSRALTTQVWYPQAAGRRPLVVFGHGYDVSPAPYDSLLEAWAAHGYVVAVPEFPLADPDVAGPNLDEADIDNQPADLRFVTDSLVAPGSPVAQMIDPARVAVAGHSDGAESALAAGIAPTPAAEPPFRALVVMSVQEMPGVAHTTNPPMLVTQGDADTINPPSYGYQVYGDGAAPKYLLVLHGGQHLPPLEAGSAWLPGIEAVTEAFLDAYVASDAPAGGIRGSVPASSLFAFQSS